MLNLLSWSNYHPLIREQCCCPIGYAQLVHLVGDWLDLATRLENPKTDMPQATQQGKHSISTSMRETSTTNENNSDDVIPAKDQTVNNLLCSLIKQKFDKVAADAILDTGTEVPSWLLLMMEDQTWRRLLIELYDQNRGSALLGYCLRKISSLGFHR